MEGVLRRPAVPVAAWFAPCLVLSFVLGCEDEAPLDLTRGCDILRADCQAAVFRLTAETRAQPDAPMPPVRTQTREGLRTELEEASAERGDSGPWTLAFQQLGLLSAGVTLSEASVDQSVANVAAYYRPSTGQVTVLERGPSDPLDDAFLLAHEFTHALQDESVDLRGLFATWVDSTDAEVSLRALTEGEAIVIASEVVARMVGAGAVIRYDRLIDAIDSGYRQQLATAPEPLLAALSNRPYLDGLRALVPIFEDRGPEAFGELYAKPVTRALAWMDGEVAPGEDPSEPLDCEPTQGPAGYTAYDHDTLGSVGLFALVYPLRGQFAEAESWSERWRNDRMVVFVDPEQPEAVAVAWRIRLDAETAIGGAEALVMDLPDAVTRVDGQELVLYGASDSDVLAGWLEGDGCGVADDLPVRGGPMMTPMTELHR